jgi:hypothetical protein
MSETTLAILGIAAPIINTIGLVPYLRDIFRHKTKPERATWWIWLALVVIALVAQMAAGATWSLGFTIGNTIAIGIIAVLSIPYGYGRFRLRDAVSLFVASVGVVLSLLTRSPLAALLTVVAVDAAGFWLTIAKTWEAPHSETLLSWKLSTVAAMASVLSVGALSFTKLLYPFYVFLGNALLVLIIIYRRKK